MSAAVFADLASPEAEAAMLGGCLIAPQKIPVIASYVRGDDFSLLRNAHIWAAMTRLAKSDGMTIDVVTLAAELRDMGKLELIGGDAALTQLMIDTPSSLNVEVYARLVQRAAIRRKVAQAGNQMISDAKNESITAPELQGLWDARGREIRGAAMMREQKPLDALVSDELARIADIMDGRGAAHSISTGLIDLDRVMGGWQAGEYIILGGRPGMGKTAALLGTAAAAASQGKSVCWVALEMTSAALTRRLISQYSGIPAQQLTLGKLNQDEYKRVLKASERVARLTPYIHIRQHGKLSPDGVKSEAYQVAGAHGLDLLIVDYLQLLRPDTQQAKRDRYSAVTEITVELAALAQDFNIPVIAAAQLSRAVEQRQDKRPMLSDLRESGQIEQDADKVIFLYRDAVYNAATEFPNQASFIVAKNRNGRTGTADVYFNAPTMSFVNGRQIEVSLARESR